MENVTSNNTKYAFPDRRTEGTTRSCFFSGVPQDLQLNFFYYSNFILTPLTVLLGLWCLLSNGSVLIAILRGGLQIRAGLWYLCSLTLSDLLWAGLVIPVYIRFRVAELISGKACSNRSDWDNPFMISSFFLCIFATMGSLGVMSVDRHLAVSKPVWYKVAVKKRYAIFACCGVWVISLSVVVLKQVALFSRRTVEVFEAFYMVLFSALTITVQVLTLVVLRRHNNSIANAIQGGAQVNSPGIAVERQLAVVARHVVALLGLLIIPISLTVALSYFLQMKLNPFTEPLYFPLATLLSGINPVLYYRGNVQIREGIAKLVKCQ